jgi:regulator of cell morphogenesis and NO signaling
MTECSPETSAPDWIIDYPDTLAVFQELGLDYTCSGKSPGFACRERGLPEQHMLSKLHNVINGGIQTANPFSPN